MLLWFAVPTVLAVFAIFRDPSVDYRLVAVGAVLPDIIDGVVARRMAWAHSVVVVVGILFALMLATIGRRLLRKKVLAVPIGMFGHLVLDGAWLTTGAFWWPVTAGVSRSIPVIERGLIFGLCLELLGLVAAVYFIKRCKLDTAARRRLILRTGTLDPRLIDPSANPLRRPRKR